MGSLSSNSAFGKNGGPAGALTMTSEVEMRDEDMRKMIGNIKIWETRNIYYERTEKYIVEALKLVV